MSWHWDEKGDASGVDVTRLTERWAQDDPLSADLGDALAEQALTERVIAGSRVAFAAHRGMVAASSDLDLELMLLALVYDSHAEAAPTGVRDRAGGISRTLVFESEDLGVEVEVEEDSIEGQLIPPRAGRVTLRSPDATLASTETDEVGYFRFDVHPGGPLRLECSNGSGACVTEWLPW